MPSPQVSATNSPFTMVGSKLLTGSGSNRFPWRGDHQFVVNEGGPRGVGLSLDSIKYAFPPKCGSFLEQQEVPVLEEVCRGQSAEPPTHDDDVVPSRHRRSRKALPSRT